jgi:hypothetical protein
MFVGDSLVVYFGSDFPDYYFPPPFEQPYFYTLKAINQPSIYAFAVFCRIIRSIPCPYKPGAGC